MLAAGKAEGTVVVASQAGSGVLDSLSGDFSKTYPGIKVDFTAENGSETDTRIITEQKAGKFTTDVVVNGTTTLFTLASAGGLDPLAPWLVGPQTQETSQWLGGKYTYADDAGKYILMLAAGVAAPFIYNSTLVNPSEFKSWRDLLNPKWKGKMSMFDPQVAGNGTATAQFWYITPTLGKDFIMQFFQQQGVVLSRDDRQMSDWAGQGQYPIGVAAQGFQALVLKKQGVPLEFLASTLQEGSYLTTSWGSVAVLTKAPHPNATKVYLNWLLSKDGQSSMAKAAGYPSRRLDASTEGLIPATIPKQGVQYQELNAESFVRSRPEALDYVKSVLPKT
ncbi:MAG TPA: extracellular solute-binding protein [Chloroflexota bacterium]|nr:extracellular solute-binding protein [Chloroflexota bacterium]